MFTMPCAVPSVCARIEGAGEVEADHRAGTAHRDDDDEHHQQPQRRRAGQGQHDGPDQRRYWR